MGAEFSENVSKPGQHGCRLLEKQPNRLSRCSGVIVYEVIADLDEPIPSSPTNWRRGELAGRELLRVAHRLANNAYSVTASVNEHFIHRQLRLVQALQSRLNRVDRVDGINNALLG